MKSEKEKSKSKKKANDNDLLKVKKTIPDKSQISLEEIRVKANQIYLQRTELGEYGTAENDWIEAEKLLSESEG